MQTDHSQPSGSRAYGRQVLTVEQRAQAAGRRRQLLEAMELGPDAYAAKWEQLMPAETSPGRVGGEEAGK